MKLYKQNKPQCLLYAFAMVMDVEPKVLIDEIGHEGELGYHPQELIDCCLSREITVTRIDSVPVLAEHKLWSRTKCQRRIHQYLNNYDGVITDRNHAVAWEHTERKIYDPKGYIYDLTNQDINYFFILI